MPHEPITVANEVGRLLDLLEADLTPCRQERIEHPRIQNLTEAMQVPARPDRGLKRFGHD
jgi:hypothetical protein